MVGNKVVISSLFRPGHVEGQGSKNCPGYKRYPKPYVIEAKDENMVIFRVKKQDSRPIHVVVCEHSDATRKRM